MATRTPHVERLSMWPDLAALHTHEPDRYPFLLESVAHGPPQARWDFLLCFPGERLWVAADGTVHTPAGHPGSQATFLDALDAWWKSDRDIESHHAEVPFCGGWFLFCAYELAGQIEPTLSLPIDPADPLPMACAVRTPVAILRDYERQCAWLVGEAGQEDALRQVRRDLQKSTPASPFKGSPVCGMSEEPPERYLASVRRAREYIHDGDIFQANLSRRWSGELAETAQAFDCYRSLCRHNPAPFAGFMRWSAEVAVASSSPERLVRVNGRRVETRPIAGTRRRGANAAADAALSAELLAHPKERAEHVMLIDLERNDLGRISEYGTVVVDEMMGIESYATVQHIVSNVSGTLRQGISPGQVIAATFPGGTITGCPKVRCMEIIAELEAAPRGAYTGSFGWLTHSGDMDLNILIRTLTVRGRALELRAGGGIVADSDADHELDESRAKAAGLLDALAEKH